MVEETGVIVPKADEKYPGRKVKQMRVKVGVGRKDGEE